MKVKLAVFGFTICLLSSCTLVDVGLAYLGYTVVATIVCGALVFLFNILHGMTNSFGWSLFLTAAIALFLMAIIFRW